MSSRRAASAPLFLAILLFLSLLSTRAAADDKLPFPEPRDWHDLPESALITTTMGDVEIAFYREEAPVSVRNFQYLVENGRYNNVLFHYFVEDFIIQGGDVTGTGKGGPGYTLPPEISKVRHAVGTVGWARLPNEVNAERRSNGSQFYISLAPNRHLNGLYTIFAHVVRGMDVVEQLRKGDRIIRVRLPKGFKGSGPDPLTPRPSAAPSPAADATRPDQAHADQVHADQAHADQAHADQARPEPSRFQPTLPRENPPPDSTREPLVPNRPPQRPLPPLNGNLSDGDSFAIPDPD